MQTDAQHVTALYTIELGKRHVVDSVTVTGNKYFSTELITERLSVRPNSFLDRYGAFSQQLVAQDIASIKALYMSNGFSAVKVTTKFTDSDTGAASPSKISHFKIELCHRRR